MLKVLYYTLAGVLALLRAGEMIFAKFRFRWRKHLPLTCASENVVASSDAAFFGADAFATLLGSHPPGLVREACRGVVGALYRGL